jgi:lipopolysaccharide export LptBFGC system permease protein LptF
LGLFAFSVSAAVKSSSRALVLGLAGVMAYAAQYVILPAAVPALAQSVPAALAAWTPNLIFAAATARLLKASGPGLRRSSVPNS